MLIIKKTEISNLFKKLLVWGKIKKTTNYMKGNVEINTKTRNQNNKTKTY